MSMVLVGGNTINKEAKKIRMSEKEKKNLPELTIKLQSYQFANRLSNAEFAKELGMSAENWTKIKNGQRGYGALSIKGILNWNKLPNLPELIKALEPVPDPHRLKLKEQKSQEDN